MSAKVNYELDGSLFISEQIHEHQVKLSDGKEHTLYFKEVPAAVFRRYGMAERSEDEETRAGSMAYLIAASLCDPNGKPAISYEHALRLKSDATWEIFQKVLEVNRSHPADPGKA